MVTVPFVVFGLLLARLRGIAHVVDVATPFWMLTYVPPAKEYARSWVRLELALGVLMVIVVPISALVALRVGVVARGIVFSVPVPLPVLVPIDAPANVMLNAWENE
jgi:hypothetical protein